MKKYPKSNSKGMLWIEEVYLHSRIFIIIKINIDPFSNMVIIHVRICELLYMYVSVYILDFRVEISTPLSK